MVKTRNHDNLLNPSEQCISKDAQMLRSPYQSSRNAIGKNPARRPYTGKQKNRGEKYGQHRRHQKLHRIRNPLIEKLIQLRYYKAHHQSNNNTALEADKSHIQSKKMENLRRHGSRAYGIRICQGAVQHNCSHHHAKHRISPEPLYGGIAYGHRQNGKDSRGSQTGQLIEGV